MPLVDSRSFNLVPDLTQALNTLLQGQQNKKAEALAQEEKALTQSKAQAQKVGAQALDIVDAGGYQQQRKRIAINAQEALKSGSGKESELWQSLLDIQNEDELRMRLHQVGVKGADHAKLINERLKPITAVKGGLASAKTEILSNGVTIQTIPTGPGQPARVVVTDGLGAIVEGQERLDAIKEAETQKQESLQKNANRQVNTARQIEQVKDAEGRAAKAFNIVDSIRTNIADLEEAARLSEEGANTGPIISMFPSFKKETIRLENMQKRLGLNVVGATTFGALSKGELDLAKDVALPTKLPPAEMVKWIRDRIKAQRTVSDYMEEQATFLSNGNTQNDWVKKKRAEYNLFKSDPRNSRENITETMKQTNMTRAEVVRALIKRQQNGGN